ncbi:hypothetical protein R9X47_01365 [Wukongibacter baidiensis]|uniref:hypothetical protein n=1 Tax=Wukongibacter baidiensis TaxID=1723361 RepID=UPI003D7FDD95
MYKNNDTLLAIIGFTMMFGSLALMWFFPSFFTFGVILLLLCITAIFYFVLFHGKVKPIWGVLLTSLIWLLIFLGTYIERLPLIKKFVESESWIIRNTLGRIIVTISIALVLLIFKIPRD